MSQSGVFKIFNINLHKDQSDQPSKMPTAVTRSTVTTTRTTTGGGSIRMIPLWSIKLITAILSCVVLILILLEPKGHWHYYAKTFLVLVMTSGFLLGWALPPVLGRFLPFHKVDVALYSFIAVLTIASLVACAIYLIDNDYYSRTENYRLMLGIAICIGIEALVCCVLLSWVLFGSYTVVETR